MGTILAGDQIWLNFAEQGGGPFDIRLIVAQPGVGDQLETRRCGTSGACSAGTNVRDQVRPPPTG